MSKVVRRLGFAALSLSAALPLVGQGQAAPLVVERVVAVVGHTAITQTMVDEEVFRYPAPVRQAWSEEIMAKTRRAIVDTLVGQELIYQEALRDTMIKVSDQEVSERVEAQIKSIRANYTNPADLNRELRDIGYRDLDDYRQRYTDQTRRQYYIGRFLAQLREKKTIQSLNPTEREVRTAYDNAVASGQMDMIPPSVSFRQLVLAAKPTEAAMAKARTLVDSLIDALHKGADFGTLARQFSMDPGSAVLGGDLRWHRKDSGDFVKEFEDAAFKLKPGEVSAPVQSPYGLHIVQVSQVQGNEAHIFHILISPEIDAAGAAATRALADTLRAALVRGASIDSLQLLYHDPVEARGTNGAEPKAIDDLPVEYQAIKPLSVGDISPVLTLGGTGTDFNLKYLIVKVTGKYPAGPMPYDAVRQDIRDALALQLGQASYIKDLRRRTYVDIRMP